MKDTTFDLSQLATKEVSLIISNWQDTVEHLPYTGCKVEGVVARDKATICITGEIINFFLFKGDDDLRKYLIGTLMYDIHGLQRQIFGTTSKLHFKYQEFDYTSKGLNIAIPLTVENLKDTTFNIEFNALGLLIHTALSSLKSTFVEDVNIMKKTLVQKDIQPYVGFIDVGPIRSIAQLMDFVHATHQRYPIIPGGERAWKCQNKTLMLEAFVTQDDDIKMTLKFTNVQPLSINKFDMSVVNTCIYQLASLWKNKIGIPNWVLGFHIEWLRDTQFNIHLDIVELEGISSNDIYKVRTKITQLLASILRGIYLFKSYYSERAFQTVLENAFVMFPDELKQRCTFNKA